MIVPVPGMRFHVSLEKFYKMIGSDIQGNKEKSRKMFESGDAIIRKETSGYALDYSINHFITYEIRNLLNEQVCCTISVNDEPFRPIEFRISSVDVIKGKVTLEGVGHIDKEYGIVAIPANIKNLLNPPTTGKLILTREEFACLEEAKV